MITDTFLCGKRQEILGLFSLERRQVRGGTRTAREPCSTDVPLVSPFLIAEKERDVQRRADAGETVAQRGTRVSMESCKRLFKRNSIPLGRNPPLWLGEGGMRTYIPIHWEMLHLRAKNSNHLQSCGLHTGLPGQHQTQQNLLLCDLISPWQSLNGAVTPQIEWCTSPAPALPSCPVGNEALATIAERCWLPFRS